MIPTVHHPVCQHVRGFNYQPSYGSTGYELWRNFDAAVIERELGRGKLHFPDMNQIRLWLSWDAFLREPKKFASNFDRALGVAASHGLKVMPVLFNRWHDAQLDYGGIYIDHFLPEAGFMQKPGMFDAYLDEIVGAHAGDDRIFAWDLCNEPFLYFRGKAHLPQYPAEMEAEMAWLRGLYAHCKAFNPQAPVTVGTHQQTSLASIDEISDILCVHPYFNGRMKYPNDQTYEEMIDGWVAHANKVNKPLLASECCWGSEDDAQRVEYIRHTLGLLRERKIGFLVYLLHHSLIADAHRVEYGPVGSPGNLSFIEADGSLRPGHGVWNEFV